MLTFCTLFDSNYLSRGLAMYESLKKHCKDFCLYIFAFDDKSYEILNKLNLPFTIIISLKEFENEKLLSVKTHRSKQEYCWTCTSSTISYIFKKYNVPVCTYLDADIYFYSSPKTLLDELQDNSILITEHRYSPQYSYRSKNTGKYCVQFITFKNDKRGLLVLNWWINDCIDWCYDRFENGKFGDQKYLNDWPARFKGVYELQNSGGGVGPWNVQRYSIFTKNNRLMSKEIQTSKEFEIIFYHFHGLKFYTNKKINLHPSFKLSEDVKNLIYKPYIKELESIKQNIQKIDITLDPGGSIKEPISWKTPFIIIKRKFITKNYNIYSLYSFLNK